MKVFAEGYRQAVEKAIKANHALGLPVYQCKDGCIIAIYPDGREIKLQKVRGRRNVVAHIENQDLKSLKTKSSHKEN